ncbi:MAG: hypothetical protein JXR56_01150 [Candidatus Cloacimonetes bacterium]|nr:hypothetical protein [Candidatus Cloacimonadota bacterium]
MKVVLSYPFLTLKGTRAKSVYYHSKNSYCVTMREYVVPTPTENNEHFGSKSANLGAFYRGVEADYHYDLSNYARSYNIEYMDPYCYYQAYSVFIRMMSALGKAYPEIDLKTITPAEVVSQGLPVVTLAEAIEAGLLPVVPDYRYLNHPILG